jgi:hypothetical protein
LESLKSPLFILTGVQTVIAAALLFKMSVVEKQLARAASSPEPIAETRLVASNAPAGAAGLTEAEIRAVLRDELSSLTTALADRAPASSPPPSPQRTAQSDRAFLDVQMETRRLIAKGVATEAEMAALETQIAELPPEQRRQALSAISRAVSNGTLDAKF